MGEAAGGDQHMLYCAHKRDTQRGCAFVVDMQVSPVYHKNRTHMKLQLAAGFNTFLLYFMLQCNILCRNLSREAALYMFASYFCAITPACL